LCAQEHKLTITALHFFDVDRASIGQVGDCNSLCADLHTDDEHISNVRADLDAVPTSKRRAADAGTLPQLYY
jgi:hypothetical protein